MKKRFWLLLILFISSLFSETFVDIITLDDKTVLYAKLLKQTSTIIKIQINNKIETYPIARVLKIEYAKGRLSNIYLKDGIIIKAVLIELNDRFLTAATDEKSLEVEREKISQIEFLEEKKLLPSRTKTGVLNKMFMLSLYSGASSSKITTWTEDEAITDGGHSEITQEVSLKASMPMGAKFSVFFNTYLGFQTDIFISEYSIVKQTCKVKFSNISKSIPETEFDVSFVDNKYSFNLSLLCLSFVLRYPSKLIQPYLGISGIIGNVRMKGVVPFRDIVGREIENFKYFSGVLGYRVPFGCMYSNFEKKRQIFLFVEANYGQVFMSYNFDVIGTDELNYLGEFTLTFFNYLVAIGYRF